MTSKNLLDKRATRRVFDKYEYYARAVQEPEEEVRFFLHVAEELHLKKPQVLREDFCGTFQNCCAWVKDGKDNVAYGLDLDPEPIEYGRKRYLPKLSRRQRERVHIELRNVLDPEAPAADVIAALNFSYMIFKRRAELRAYFRNCLRALPRGGILFLDSFGGSRCQGEFEDRTGHGSFTYFWHQTSFDPVTHYATFHIHFRQKGRRKIEKVFTYDWRLWTIPELRELMEEVGFRESLVYWEGTEGEGGDGIFTRTEAGEECEAWLAYVVGIK